VAVVTQSGPTCCIEFKVKLVRLQDFPVVGANIVAKVKATSMHVRVKYFIMLVSIISASQIKNAISIVCGLNHFCFSAFPEVLIILPGYCKIGNFFA
jgi:hypothetical protein